MSTHTIIKPISVEDYLILEECSDTRHEYYHGAIEGMLGVTARHNQITTAVASILRSHLKEKGCSVFSSDMKVYVKDVFYYPDVMVVCVPIDPNSLFQTEPALLVEVLSNSTEKKDRLEKLVAYQSINSVSEYILVSQDKIAIDAYKRHGEGWQLESLSKDDTLELASIEYSAPVEGFYEDVIHTYN